MINLVHHPEAGKSREKLATVHVLVLPEGGQWCAIALEAGIRCYADTAPLAHQTLKEAVEAQVTFTMEQGAWSEMFETQAELHYIELYFQTSAFQAKGGFHVLDPDMAASPSYRRASDENVINLGSASEGKDAPHTYEPTA